MIWGLSIIIASLIPCLYAWIYFKKQKSICQKYPFFLLRDKIILAIVNTDKHEELMKSYELVNYVAKKLKVSMFGVKFFVDVMAEKLSSLIEKYFQLALKSPIHEIEKIRLNEFDRELAELVMTAAKKNNWLLMFAMTRIGFRIMFLPVTIKGCYRILKRHPYLVNNFFGRYTRAAQRYSFLSQAINAPTSSRVHM